MKNCIRLIILLSLSLLCLNTLAQDSLSLKDWSVLDPWENSCDIAEFSKAEEKLYINISSKAFTWMTGTVEQAHYEPIGELANYFGFAKLRNEIRDNSNNPLADENFRGSSWLVVLENLDSAQREILYSAAKKQEEAFFGFLDERVHLIDILYDLKEGKEIDLAVAINHIKLMGEYEAQISLVSAKAFGEVALTLTAEQKAFFADIRKGILIVSELKGNGPYVSMINDELNSLSANQEDLMTEVASKFLSYETGSLEDAIYLPSGKIGNFFGFASYRYEERANVSRSQASDLINSVLTEEQKQVLKCLTSQVYRFEQSYISSRAGLITDIYPLKSGQTVNDSSIISDYQVGATDEGKMGIVQAIYFDYLERLLTEEQVDELIQLRAETGSGSSRIADVTDKTTYNFRVFPNPFNERTTLSFVLEKPQLVSVEVYNTSAQKLTFFNKNSLAVGYHEMPLSLLDKGIYLCRITFDSDFPIHIKVINI